MRRRLYDRVLWSVMLAVGAALVMAALILARPDTIYDIREDRLMTDTTPIHHTLRVWTRYDVPLSDDLQLYTEDICEQYGVPVPVVLAVMDVESSFDPDTIGDGGASFGLMQIWAAHHTERCIRLNAYNLTDPRQNIRVGVDYLAELLDDFDGDMAAALSYYNGGGGVLPNAYADRVLARAEEIEETASISTTEE